MQPFLPINESKYTKMVEPILGNDLINLFTQFKLKLLNANTLWLILPWPIPDF